MYLRLRQLRESSGPSSMVLIIPPKKPLMTRGPTSGIHAQVRHGTLFDVSAALSCLSSLEVSKGLAIASASSPSAALAPDRSDARSSFASLRAASRSANELLNFAIRPKRLRTV